MKPPPRTRTKPSRRLEPDVAPRASRKLSVDWPPVEQRKLLNALRSLGRTLDGCGDVDYAFLSKQVPTRSVSEILTVSSTEPCTLRNCDPPKVHRPPTGADRPVGRTVSLRPMPRLPVKGVRTDTSRPRPLFVMKTPSPILGPAHRLPAISKVVRVPNCRFPPPQHQPSPTAGVSTAATCSSLTAVTSNPPGTAKIHFAPPATSKTVAQTMIPVTPSSNSTVEGKIQDIGSSVNQTTLQPLEQQPTTTSNIKFTTSSLLTPLSSSTTSLSLLPSTAPSSGASSIPASSSCSSSRPMPPLSTHAAEFHTSFGCTSKVTSKDSPITFGVKCIVDFERIYRYLSVIHKPDEECHLTPMESAIMLDLLMSLPEEMPLLDCTKLQKHLTQVYQCLSSPANSKMAREMFKDLKDGPTAQGDVPSGADGNTPDGQQNTARTVDSSGVVDSEEPDVAESRSSRSKNASTQSGKADVIGPCPPLNPFLVPLKLLVRR
ncbi:uncharacterized protein PB18E9.04c isoform X2 [Scophthalmus maximus]|uniref:uncharacterized protein PB18E9.04c isoform X2 n=1 Tax=Scophthalmus maximus TaxID=52904 RepID=UPI001FA85AC5|nr:uncharacterized protein PB18E9.04c isoform X2 [Scophthalmus maximus]